MALQSLRNPNSALSRFRTSGRHCKRSSSSIGRCCKRSSNSSNGNEVQVHEEAGELAGCSHGRCEQPAGSGPLMPGGELERGTRHAPEGVQHRSGRPLALWAGHNMRQWPPTGLNISPADCGGCSGHAQLAYMPLTVDLVRRWVACGTLSPSRGHMDGQC